MPDFPIQDYINGFISSEMNKLKDRDTLLVSPPLRGIKYLLANLTNHSPRTQANLIIWKYVESLIPHLDPETRKYLLEFEKTSGGRKNVEERWYRCTKIIAKLTVEPQNILSLAVGSMYSRKYITAKIKTNVEKMVKDIKEEFKRMLKKMAWIDGNTRERFEKKQEKLRQFIAYPEEYFDDSIIDKYYSGLILRNESFLKNVFAVNKFYLRKKSEELKLWPQDNDWSWYLGAAQINAFNSNKANAIYFPAAILRGIFYNVERPAYQNYATLGWIIAHELTHGYDRDGLRFGENGQYISKFNQSTLNRFNEKSACLANQYSNFFLNTSSEESLQVNGNQVQRYQNQILNNLSKKLF